MEPLMVSCIALRSGQQRRAAMQSRKPLIAPAAKTVWEPRNSLPAGSPYLMAMNDELADKGFLVTSADNLITWARTGSLMWMQFGLACCAIEMMQIAMPRYDVERFGFAPRASPRQSNVMIVVGTMCHKKAPAIHIAYDQMPEPQYTIAFA